MNRGTKIFEQIPIKCFGLSPPSVEVTLTLVEKEQEKKKKTNATISCAHISWRMFSTNVNLTSTDEGL